ncbi:MAG: DegT/DnrJ/EryC1/StrS family aminotransferase, partial [Burkholderiaceae bacterium]
ICTGDGGMITTANADFDMQFRLLRQHAMSVPDTVRHGASQVIVESYTTLGYNYRMTDIQAAVGREQLKRLDDIFARRRELAQRYRALLAGVPGLILPHEPEWARSNWQSYCVRLPEGCEQRSVMQHMLDDGVATRRGVMCSHRERAYQHLPLRQPLPHSERAQDQCVLLPLYHQMAEADQVAVATSLEKACLPR